MESIVLSVISQYLKDYVNNYRKEQLSMNFLKGHGVIRDLDINVDAINDTVFQSGAPALRFTRILINTLSISAPIMSLKSKPVVFFIDKVFVEIAEIEEISTKKKAAQTKKPAPTTKYGLVDRIIDCISFEINQINVGYRTLGRVKSKSIGPWTPPVVLMELNGARCFCTNQNGVEASLDECLRVRPTKRPMLFLYKKLEVKKASLYLVNPEVWFSVADELTACSSKYVMSTINSQIKGATRGYVSQKIIDNMPMLMELCMRKRMDTNTTLGMEIAFVFDSVRATIRQKYLAELMHFMLGIYYSLFRTDVIKEIYGPDPHNEGANMSTNTNSGYPSPDKTATSTSATSSSQKPSLQQQSREQQARASFRSEEIADLDQLEKEMGTGATTTEAVGAGLEEDRGDSWRRSSLDSDEDPPHMRSVFVIQINEASIHIPFDDCESWPSAPTYTSTSSSSPSSSSSSSESSSKNTDTTHPPSRSHGKPSVPSSAPTPARYYSANNSNSSTSTSNKLAGITFSMLGMVYQSIWPEHASATESVLQWSIKRFDLTEYIGVQKISLFRSKEPLDAFDKPLCVSLLPRGVKEYNHSDAETHPGISLLYKKDCNWPPPPLSKGLSISSELCVCELELTAKVDALSKINRLLSSIWDSRWASGNWGDDADIGGTLDSLMGVCSCQSTIVISGVDILLYPMMQAKNSAKNVNHVSSDIVGQIVLLPSLLELKIGLVSFVWRSTIDLSCFSSFFGWSTTDTTVTDISGGAAGSTKATRSRSGLQEEEEEVPGDLDLLESPGDLTNVLHTIVDTEEQQQQQQQLRRKASNTSLPSSLSRKGSMVALSSSSPSSASAVCSSPLFTLPSSPKPTTVADTCSTGKVPLLCDRFEALLSEISLRMISDHSGSADHHYCGESKFRQRTLRPQGSTEDSRKTDDDDNVDDESGKEKVSNSSSRRSSRRGGGAPSLQKRLLIRPFSVQFLRSSDPHPLLEATQPSPSTFLDPYNREYYWPSIHTI